jgi:hypothetical protein
MYNRAGEIYISPERPRMENADVTDGQNEKTRKEDITKPVI